MPRLANYVFEVGADEHTGRVFGRTGSSAARTTLQFGAGTPGGATASRPETRDAEAPIRRAVGQPPRRNVRFRHDRHMDAAPRMSAVVAPTKGLC
jgi:hypothetical protein